MTNPLLLVAAAIAGFFAFFKSANSAAQVAPSTATALDDIYQRHARRHGLDWRLLKAIAQVESSENPNAVNPADPSFGLMQILYTGSNQFNIDDWPPARKEDLFDPDLNVHYGAQILDWNIRTYGLKRGVSVYNCWSCRTSPPEGPFPNQRYVDKVLTNYAALGGAVSG